MSEKKVTKLDDDIMSSVNGGVDKNGGLNSVKDRENVPTTDAFCPSCNKERKFYCYSGGQAICSECGFKIKL
ncbi:MAG: hypothetical protein K6B28_10445 [Lachnospiraceae bacterium]|nr:hypothetical protein [Lachnospiraceae bacterium]